MTSLIERHASEIVGVLSCFDRLVIQGTLPSICHPKAMATKLDRRGIRLFDYARFAQPFRDAIRAHAERVAAEEGVERTSSHFRKRRHLDSCGTALLHDDRRDRVVAGEDSCQD